MTLGEIKGSIIALILFIGIFLPGFLSIANDAIHNHSFLKTTAEISELVKKEGGAIGEVSTIVNLLSSRGYQISFNKTGKVPYGEQIVIHYQYTYNGVFKQKQLNTKNEVFSMAR